MHTVLIVDDSKTSRSVLRNILENNGYKVYTYFTPYHNHTILIYQDNNKYYLDTNFVKKGGRI